MLNIDSPINSLPKLQKPLIAALKKLGINTVQDLLLYLPYRYLDFSRVVEIKDIKSGENISLKATIKEIKSRYSFRGRLSLAEAVVSDNTGSLKVIWFNQPYLAQSLKPGDELYLAGTPEYYNLKLQLTNPIYEKASDFPIHTARLVPIYHLTKKIYPKTFRNLIAGALPLSSQLIETLPEIILHGQNLPGVQDMVRFSHFPGNISEVEQAKKRLAFEEIFLNQLAAQKYKLKLAQKLAYKIEFDQKLIKSFVDSFPFALTLDQKKSAWQVLQDLDKTIPMNRLLEGDVGSGKTLVALIAALQTVSSGLQVALLAPTEILARQHFETIKKFFNSDPKIPKLKLCLLTNNYSVIDDKVIIKKKMHSLISDGMPAIYVGTHSLLQKGVKFNKLALVIIDEQHRFGVQQRAHLMQTDGKVPHLMSLTATPIPRTLQMAFYGELDISRIKEKPADRKIIITKLIDEATRGETYEFISHQIKLGRQAFVITPLIEESDKLGTRAAKTELTNLKAVFPGLNIGLLHGRMSGREKEEVMADFLANKIQILVSTSVVEVGVDVPNAGVMVIEGAERFGLAQLHQFRGRVGRAVHQSYCFLFVSPPKIGGVSADLPAKALATAGGGRGGIEQNADDRLLRLQSFCKIQDGFELAELDLKQRGFGELYGEQQSGWNFKYFDSSYVSLIEPARKEARKILEKDINLDNYPLLKEKTKDKIVHFE